MLKRSVLGVLVLVAAGFAVPVSVIGRQASSPSLQAVGDMLVGNWTGEGVFAADYPGVGKKGEKFTATQTCKWAAGKSALACEGRANQSSWTGLTLWDPAAKQVRTMSVDSAGEFDQGIISKQGDKLVWSSTGHFADGRLVEYKGETLFQDNGNTRIEAGATVLAGVRSEFRDTYKKAAK